MSKSTRTAGNSLQERDASSATEDSQLGTENAWSNNPHLEITTTMIRFVPSGEMESASDVAKARTLKTEDASSLIPTASDSIYRLKHVIDATLGTQ